MTQRLILNDIRLVWTRIKPALEELQHTWQLDWKPEDIYAQCLMGIAFCYTCKDGFMILKPQENQYSLAKELFVWICYSTANDGLHEYYPDIKQLAQDIQATAIIFASPRDGFKRLAKQNNWPSMTTYTLPVI